MFYLARVCLNYHVLYENRQQQAWWQHPNQMPAGRGLPMSLLSYMEPPSVGEETPGPGDEPYHVHPAQTLGSLGV